MVAVAQLVESRIVIPVVVGSNPISHPILCRPFAPQGRPKPRIAPPVGQRSGDSRKRGGPYLAMRFTVATYNIHKGFTHFARRMVIHEVRERLHGLSADILFLQEVIGTHDRHAFRYNEWPGKPATRIHRRRDVARGRLRQERRLPRMAITATRCCRGIRSSARKTRTFPRTCSKAAGCSTARSSSGRAQPLLHCVNVHLGLFERGRRWQIRALVERITDTVPGTAPLIIAGDFNDWRRKGDRTLTEELRLSEVFEEVKGRPARTFPSVLPVFRLGSHLRAWT